MVDGRVAGGDEVEVSEQTQRRFAPALDHFPPSMSLKVARTTLARTMVIRTTTAGRMTAIRTAASTTARSMTRHQAHRHASRTASAARSEAQRSGPSPAPAHLRWGPHGQAPCHQRHRVRCRARQAGSWWRLRTASLRAGGIQRCSRTGTAEIASRVALIYFVPDQAPARPARTGRGQPDRCATR